MPALLYRTCRAEARVPSAASSPLPAVAVGAFLLVKGHASLAAEILALLRRIVPFAADDLSLTALLDAVYSLRSTMTGR